MTNEKNTLEVLSEAMAGAVAKAGASTVLVDARRRLPASGVVYTPNLILTANHVVERDEEIRVVLPSKAEMAAQVAGRDPSSDLALLRLEQADATPAEPAGDSARVGQLVLALGQPSPGSHEASLGIVSALGGPVHTRRGGTLEGYIRTDAIPYPGFSGGPLVDASGLVLGVNTSGLAHGTLLSIPVQVAWRLAQTLDKHGGIKRGYLGVRSQLVEIPQAAREELGREQETGLLLVNIEPDSPAAESDMMVGDILVGIAGTPISDHDELLGQLSGELVGKSTPVEVLRGGKPQMVEVTIGQRESHAQGPHGRHHRHHGRRGTSRRPWGRR
jgi:S1-C subfamily serine protease